MKRLVTIAIGVAALAGSASARPMFHYEFPIDGLQEVPPVVTPATGVGIVDYDSDTNFLSWTITFQDLIGTINNAHFHGPAPVGVAAGVRINIPFSPGVTAGTLIGDATISEAFETELLGGLWYVNIHSTFRPAGEIRGQVVPTPGALALVGVAGLLGVRRRRA
jgi:hypothetical protein